MKLFYKEYGQGEPPLVILHGMLGSGRNWHTVSTQLARKHRLVVPDMRNHGHSPHSEVHRLADMVEDIEALQQDLRIFPAIVLGHSMGGLVAMEMAFRVPEALCGIIVVDIAPRPHRAGVAAVLAAMARVPLHQLRSKKEVDAELAKSIADPAVRQFVLTNLIRTEAGLNWRIPLAALQAFLIESQAYQPDPTDIFEKPALFIRGEKSGYIRDQDFELIQHHFPQADIETVANAGHWVHYEAPESLLKIVESFLSKF